MTPEAQSPGDAAFRAALQRSVVLASLTVWFGLILSYHLGTAGAATIALLAIAVFFLVLAVRPLFRRREAVAA